MSSLRSSANILWGQIRTLVDGEIPNKEYLYDQAIHRLQDYGGALLLRIAKVYSDLSSTTIGTKAKVVGDVDMTAFDYNGGITLSGLTVIVDEDTSAAQIVTFDNAVTGPSQLIAQLTAQAATNLIWSLNDSGQLVAESQTAGVGSTIALGAGTAHSLVWPSPTITSPGAGTANDGASRVGVGTLPNIVGNTLRAVLLDIDNVLSTTIIDVAAKVSKAGDTMIGSLTFTSPAKVVYNATFSRPSKGKWHVYSNSTQWEFASPISPMWPIQTSVTGGVTFCDHDLDVIPGDVLDGVDVWSFSDGASHSDLPGTMPKIRIYKQASNASSPTALGASAEEDPSADAAEFDAIHAISITGLAETIVADTRYFVRYSGEDGANEIANRTLLNVMINGTSNGLPPGL